MSLGWKGEEIDTQGALALLAECLSLTDEEEKIYDCLTAWISFYKGRDGVLKEISDYPKEVYKAFKKDAEPLVDLCGTIAKAIRHWIIKKKPRSRGPSRTGVLG